VEIERLDPLVFYARIRPGRKKRVIRFVPDIAERTVAGSSGAAEPQGLGPDSGHAR
jgi:hypothetical protein